MALITKNELIKSTQTAQKVRFENRHYSLLSKMREAAEQGENYIIFDEMDLSNEFIMWLYKEKFRVCGLNSLSFTKIWESIDDPNNIGAYRTIRVSWED